MPTARTGTGTAYGNGAGTGARAVPSRRGRGSTRCPLCQGTGTVRLINTVPCVCTAGLPATARRFQADYLIEGFHPTHGWQHTCTGRITIRATDQATLDALAALLAWHAAATALDQGLAQIRVRTFAHLRIPGAAQEYAAQVGGHGAVQESALSISLGKGLADELRHLINLTERAADHGNANGT